MRGSSDAPDSSSALAWSARRGRLASKSRLSIFICLLLAGMVGSLWCGWMDGLSVVVPLHPLICGTEIEELRLQIINAIGLSSR
jgi:hypothetical protein